MAEVAEACRLQDHLGDGTARGEDDLGLENDRSQPRPGGLGRAARASYGFRQIVPVPILVWSGRLMVLAGRWLMLGEALAALASAGATALVSAMVTDGWESVRGRFARLLGRGDARLVQDAVKRLEASRALLAGQAGPELERGRAEQEVAWRIRLADLLEDHPEVEGELRAAVANVQAHVVGSAGRVQQWVTGEGQAQQAVQGHGVQANIFGGHGEPGSDR
jgi:hypothetical protein